MINATSLFMAGRALENAGNIAIQNLGQPERAADMYKRASELYMQNMTPDRAAEMLEKSARAMEPISVDAAIDLYIGACNIYENEERAKYATDTYKRTISLLVKHKRYEKATEILQRLGNVQKDTANKSSYYKTLLSIIIVQLAAGDEVEAGKLFQSFCIVDGFVRSEESNVAHAMLDAFEHRDQNFYNQTAARQHVGFLDNEIARLARNIVISNDLISGGGYVDPNGAPGPGPSGPPGPYQQQQQPPQHGGFYNNNNNLGGNNNFNGPPPPRQPSPYQPPGFNGAQTGGNNNNEKSGTTSGGYDISPASHRNQDERSDADWRALTSDRPASANTPPQIQQQPYHPHQQPQQQQPSQHFQQPPQNQQHQHYPQPAQPPSRNYYQDADDDGDLL
ncbi:hypothetical protein BGW38_000936 [Lunasporangiospora selenospora]|uniref:Gamma-soluble NSF attachment protein n=1 Tax=Lunasporangiospora selenospora TaxID=979761 RepID=A0A9P6FUF0_9FUNG|nr:hypothetical protein BGW38_000936 [Lunasporangiospora selenospora]